MAPASSTPRASAYKTASKTVVTETEPAAPEAYTQDSDDYVYNHVPREKLAPVANRRTETVQYQIPQSAGPQNAAPALTSFRCSRRHPRHSSDVETPAAFTPRVSWSGSLADVATRS